MTLLLNKIMMEGNILILFCCRLKCTREKTSPLNILKFHIDNREKILKIINRIKGKHTC